MRYLDEATSVRPQITSYAPRASHSHKMGPLSPGLGDFDFFALGGLSPPPLLYHNRPARNPRQPQLTLPSLAPHAGSSACRVGVRREALRAPGDVASVGSIYIIYAGGLESGHGERQYDFHCPYTVLFWMPLAYSTSLPSLGVICGSRIIT